MEENMSGFTRSEIDAMKNRGIVELIIGVNNISRVELDDLIESVKNVLRRDEKSIILNNLLRAMSKKGMAEKALNVVEEEITVKRDRVIALTSIAEGLIEVEAFNKSEEVLDEALEIARGIQQQRDKVESLSKIARSLAHMGKIKRAKETANNALKIAEWFPGEIRRAKSQMFTEVAGALAETGQIDRAFTITERIPFRMDRSSPLKFIAIEMAKKGNFEKAIEISKRIPSISEKHEANSEIAGYMAYAGDFDEALMVARKISKKSYRAIALKNIADSVVEGDRHDKAKAIIDEAIDVAEEVSDGPKKASILKDLSEVLAKIDQDSRANKVLNESFNLVREMIVYDNLISTPDELIERIQDQKEQINILSEKGIDVEHFQEQLKKAELSLEAGNFDNCIQELEELEEQDIDELISTADELIERIQNLKDDIKKLNENGMDTSELRSGVKESKTLYEEGKLERCRQKVERIIKEMKNIKGDLRPKLEVNFLQSQKLEPEVWGVVNFEIRNKGEIHAENVNFDITGELKSHGLTQIDRIETGSTENLELRLQPLGKGHIPIEVKTEYKGVLDGKEYQEVHLPDVVVGKEVKTMDKDEKEDEVEKDYKTKRQIKKKIELLTNQEDMLDVKRIETSLEEDQIEKAGELLRELEVKFENYQKMLDRLRDLDDRKSSLAERLAEGEIDHEAYKSAVQSIDGKKAGIEEELNDLRREVIYEDYQKPF